MGKIHDLEPTLREQSFFQGLPEQHLKLLAGCATNVRFNAGAHLCTLGGAADQFFLLRDGKVSVEIHSPTKGAISLQTLGSGDVVGWSWLFPPFTWNFDARALELTRAVALDAKCLRAKCDADHDLGYEMMKRFSSIMADRLHATRIQLLDLYQ